MMTDGAGPPLASEPTWQRLRTVSLFASLADETIQRIAEAALLRSYAADEHILLEGDAAEAAYFILDGEVRIYRVSAEGREQVLARLEPGQAFNTVPHFLAASGISARTASPPPMRNPANVVALTPATLCVLLHDDFLTLIEAHGDLALAVLRDFAQRLAHFTDLVEGLALQTVQQRLAGFLIRQAEAKVGQPPAAQRWTQQEIAVHLGTVRDVVGRELRAFEAMGLVRIERGRIVLLDREALQRIAGG